MFRRTPANMTDMLLLSLYSFPGRVSLLSCLTEEVSVPFNCVGNLKIYNSIVVAFATTLIRILFFPDYSVPCVIMLSVCWYRMFFRWRSLVRVISAGRWDIAFIRPWRIIVVIIRRTTVIIIWRRRTWSPTRIVDFLYTRNNDYSNDFCCAGWW